MATIFGIWTKPVGLHNLTGLPGGFMPHGFGGVWMAVIIGVFSFNGIEVIAVTSGEAKDPVRTIPAALRTMALRLFLFYILALTIVVTFVPWTETGAAVVTQSPFVRVFAHSGIRHAAGIMNFVVLSAALSSMNTNVYLCSRMLFSLSRGGYAPRFLGSLSKNGTPITAILLSGACILIAAGVSKLTPLAYNYLFGIALFDAMIVWIIILLSHLSFRRRHRTADLPVRMPLFPVIQIAGLALLCAVLVTMGLDKEIWRISWIVGVPWLALISVVYFLLKARRRRYRMQSGISSMPQLTRREQCTMEPNFQSLRKEFPVLERKTYLNSGSYCALANDVKAAFEAYMEDRLLVGANWDVWITKNESVRALTATLLHAAPDEIAVTASVSAGLNALASALDFSGPRNKVVVSDFEFPTNAQIWHAQEPRGARVVHVPRAADGYIPLENFAEAIDEQTQLVAITHVCFRNGAKLDIPGIVRLARAKGAQGAARLLPIGRLAGHRREGSGRRLRRRRHAQVSAGHGRHRLSLCPGFFHQVPRTHQ